MKLASIAEVQSIFCKFKAFSRIISKILTDNHSQQQFPTIYQLEDRAKLFAAILKLVAYPKIVLLVRDFP